MDKLIGLKINYECEKCGSSLSTKCMASDADSLKAGIYAPTLCGCGAKRNFKIIGLEQIELVEKGGE